MRWFTDWFRRGDDGGTRPVGVPAIFARLRGEAPARSVRRREATRADGARTATAVAPSPTENAASAAAAGGAALLGVEAVDIFGLHAPGPLAAGDKAAESGSATSAAREPEASDDSGDRSSFDFSWGGDGDGGGDGGGGD